MFFLGMMTSLYSSSPNFQIDNIIQNKKKIIAKVDLAGYAPYTIGIVHGALELYTNILRLEGSSETVFFSKIASLENCPYSFVK